MVFKVKGKVLTKEEMAVKQAKKDVANQKVQAEAKAKSLADAEKKKQAIKEAELAVESKTTKKKSSL